MKRFKTKSGYVHTFEPYEPEGEPLWQRGVSILYVEGYPVFSVPTTDEGTQDLADVVDMLYQYHKEVQDHHEEVEERIREEGSEASRD